MKIVTIRVAVNDNLAQKVADDFCDLSCDSRCPWYMTAAVIGNPNSDDLAEIAKVDGLAESLEGMKVLEGMRS